jgi:ABC-2 type transport system permease protein
MRNLRIYFRILGAHLRSTLEYEADFWIMIVAGVLFQVLNLLFLGAIFSHVPAINGWSYAECVLISGLYGIIAGLSPLFLEGMWGLSWRVNQGKLDYPLVRPAAVPAQVMGSTIGLHGFGDVMIGGAMVGWALTKVDVTWSPATVLIGLILFVSGAAVHLSLITMFTLITFWIPGPHPFFAIAMHNVEDMVRYPITIYGLAVRAAFTVLVPFAFVTYFPVAWLLGKSDAWIGLLTPLVALYCLWLARTIFRRGLLRYDSAGH